MENFQHKDLAAGRWQEMTLAEQMGNIGSEVGRAVSAQNRGDANRLSGALDRAFELIDLTAGDNRWRGSRRKEILRSREVLADIFFGDKRYGGQPESLEKYFYHFAVAARNK